MALIECPDCGHRVSDAAPQCPECGRPIRRESFARVHGKHDGAFMRMLNSWVVVVLVFILLAVILGIIAGGASRPYPH